VRRLGAVALALLVMLVAAPPSFASVTLTKPERQLLVLINRTRVNHNLHRLRVVTCLERAARAHSREMVSRHYFRHESYSGESFGSRLIRFGYKTSGFTSWKAGENIAWGSGSLGAPKAIWRAWMKSAPHRAIILMKGFRDVGLGRAVGSYQGLSHVVFFTLDCGVRTR
jgi:uncharacterized protein YkwD